jgi:hypothetical protein
MDKKSKILIALFFAIVLISASFTYYKIVIKQDFIISGEADCDPNIERCFARPCGEDNECRDPTAKFSYYKIVNKNFKNVECGVDNENCRVLTCNQEEKNCDSVLCNGQNMKKGEECNDPEIYNAGN